MKQGVKNNIKNALLFLLGVIVTIIITKISDKIIPNDSVIVKQYTDTLKIIHDYQIPSHFENDSIIRAFEEQVKNLELLNSYDKLIKERVAIKEEKGEIFPNLVLSKHSISIGRKGYIQGSSASYFSSDCPNLDSQHLDLHINFMNPLITKDIDFLRVNIYRFENRDDKEARTFVLEDFYEVRAENNIIRINNDFGKGRYEIIYGFMFKNDLNTEYPTFYFKRCVVTKQ